MPPKKDPAPPVVIWNRDYRTDYNGDAIMHWTAVDHSGQCHNVLAPRHLQHHPVNLRTLLTDHMAALPTNGTAALAMVNAAIDRGSANAGIGILTQRTGWYQSSLTKTFVFSDKTLGDQNVVHRSRLVEAVAKPTVAGTLKSWRKGLKKPCRSSAFLIFAISLAFAGPTLRFYPGGTGLLFNLAGETGGGKTSILLAAISTMTQPSNQKLVSTNITSAGLEEKSLELNDLILCLDEFGAALATPKLAASLIHTLAYQTREGRGKTRNSVGQKALAYDHATWALSVLTSSENTLDSMMGDEKRELGAQMRYVDILVPNRSDGGAFPGILLKKDKGVLGGAELSRLLEDTIGKNYGTAMPKFVETLMAEPNLEAKLVKYRNEFVSSLKARSSGQQNRYFEAFAKVFAAGRVAVEAGVAPFNLEQLSSAITKLFDDSGLVQIAKAAQNATALASLAHLGADGTRCPVLLEGKKLSNPDGSVKAVRTVRSNEDLLFIPSDHLTSFMPENLNIKAFLDSLAAIDVLKTRPGSRTKQHFVPGLERGNDRPSGYLFDWEKLQKVHASGGAITPSVD